MEKVPTTRQERKGKRGKEGKGVYNQKSIRLREALLKSRSDTKWAPKKNL